MSAPGTTGGRPTFAKPIPPERGSFPLDHDAECASQMKSYLSCLRSQRYTNADECRQLSKKYLQCRMDRNLMARDSMGNLGFGGGGGEGGKEEGEGREMMEMARETREVEKGGEGKG